MYIVTSVCCWWPTTCSAFLSMMSTTTFQRRGPEPSSPASSRSSRWSGDGGGDLQRVDLPLRPRDDWRWVQGMDTFKLVMVSAGVLYGVGFWSCATRSRKGVIRRRPRWTEARERAGAVARSAWRGPSSKASALDGRRRRPGQDLREGVLHPSLLLVFLPLDTCLWMTYPSGRTSACATLHPGRQLQGTGLARGAHVGGVLHHPVPGGWIADKLHPLRSTWSCWPSAILNSVVQSVWIFWTSGTTGTCTAWSSSAWSSCR